MEALNFMESASACASCVQGSRTKKVLATGSGELRRMACLASYGVALDEEVLWVEWFDRERSLRPRNAVQRVVGRGDGDVTGGVRNKGRDGAA